MQYICLIYTPNERPEMTPEESEKLFEEYGAYTQAARESGKMVAGEPLQPPTDATTVRVRNGKRTVTDGPFAETKEWLGGFYIFDCDTLDEVLDWAAKIPGARYGSIEVRPIMPIPGMRSGYPVDSFAK
jgi:hypothetical protein